MSAARPLSLCSQACNRYLLSGLSSEEEHGLQLLLSQLKTGSWGSRGWGKDGGDSSGEERGVRAGVSLLSAPSSSSIAWLCQLELLAAKKRTPTFKTN